MTSMRAVEPAAAAGRPPGDRILSTPPPSWRSCAGTSAARICSRGGRRRPPAGRPYLVDPDRELAELREYLGDEYSLERLQRHEVEVESEFAELGAEAFYRSSKSYLFDLTVFAMSRTKEPYLATLARAVDPPARVLDYGCGIGSDGLLLLEAGYRVEFADFPSPSTEYLRWRLRHRGLDAPIHDLDTAPPNGDFDLAYAFDVIEHVPDPFAL